MKQPIPVFMDNEIVVITEVTPVIDEAWGETFTMDQARRLEKLRALFAGPNPGESDAAKALLAAGTLHIVPRADWPDDAETDEEYLAG